MVSRRKSWDRVFSTASWLIVVGLIYSVVSLWIMPPGTGGPVVGELGILGAQVFYTALYGGEAGALAYSKFFKKKKMRKTTLMTIYITGFFTTILTMLLVGPVVKIIDNVLITVAAAGCWLYWKFKTEYIDAQSFYDETLHLRPDIPPSIKD